MALDVTEAVVQDFRAHFPEFSDKTVWPTGRLRDHLRVAADETESTRWGNYVGEPPNFRARGVFNFAAHRAVLTRATERAVANGQTPAAPAQVVSRQVGDESIQYAAPTPENSASAASVGGLRATIYGQEFLRLRRRAGTGAAVTNRTFLP